MTLFKLSYRNIKKSMKDYAIYFLTLILGVSIFYVFNALETQSAMLRVSSSTKEILKLMVSILSGVSIFVSIILGFLIIYASRFLMKRRNKEFGVYLMLGMSKRRISLILLMETILIGLISLAVGLIIGVMASQGMSIVVANLFEANMLKFKFVFSVSACMKTILYFGMMYLIVMVFNTISVSKCQLIDLINSSRKNEQIKIKNPIFCIIVFIISVGLLGYAYSMVMGNLSFLQYNINYILIPIALGVVSTVMLFWSVSGLLLRIVISFKKLYYKGLNSFVLRQVASQINTMVASMSVICIMLFMTICILSSGLSIKDSLNKNVGQNFADLQLMVFESNKGPATPQDIDEIFKLAKIDKQKAFKQKVYFERYNDEFFTLEDFLGKEYQKVRKDYPMVVNTPETIISVSDYNKIAQLYHQSTFTLNKDEYIVIADYPQMVSIRDRVLKENKSIKVFGKTLSPKYRQCIERYVDIAELHTNQGIVIVPDDVVRHQKVNTCCFIGNYYSHNAQENMKFEEKFKQNFDSELAWGMSSRLEVKESATGLKAIATFIALYLGVIFLMSSAAILALKQLSEASDNKARYNVLRKIGVDQKMMNHALFIQIGIFFMVPLLLAMIHSYAGLVFSQTILATLGAQVAWPSILSTAGIIVLIYGGYFFITYWCSQGIIRES